MSPSASARPTEAAIARLKELLGRRASDAESVREHHSHGESYHPAAAPDVVCLPQTTAEVQAIVAISASWGLPIVPFGAGTSLEGHVHALRGGIAQAGTYSGGGIASAAASATLDLLRTGEPLAKVQKTGQALMEGLEKILADQGVEGKTIGDPAMFSIFIGEGDLDEFRDTSRHDDERYDDVMFRMIRKGVMPCPDALEPWFVCAAHTEEDVATTLQVFEESLSESLADV